MKSPKKLLTLLGVIWLLLAAPLSAQTDADRARGLAYLQQTEAGVLAAAKGLSEEQLRYKTSPDRWSVADVVEHLAASEDFLFGMVSKDVMQAPARTEPTDLKALDDLVIGAITDRSHKAQAPEPLKPTNRFGSTQEALKHFEASRAKTIAFLEERKDLRDHASDSPLQKKLDAYQWLLFIGAHSERHTKQALEVKADPGFPKS